MDSDDAAAYHDSVVRLPEGWRLAERQLRALGTEDWNVAMRSVFEGETP